MLSLRGSASAESVPIHTHPTPGTPPSGGRTRPSPSTTTEHIELTVLALVPDDADADGAAHVTR